MQNNPRNKREAGQSLVELSISLVLLLTLLSGLVDLGRAFFTYIALRDAAQEGAAYAAVALGTDEFAEGGSIQAYCSAIESRARSASDTPIDLGMEAVSVDILINGQNCSEIAVTDVCLGGAVTVDVAYDDFPLTMPFIGAVLGSQTLSLSAEVVDTILTPSCDGTLVLTGAGNP